MVSVAAVVSGWSVGGLLDVCEAWRVSSPVARRCERVGLVVGGAFFGVFVVFINWLLWIEQEI
jgi:hypothetical protein